jgi:hypothetical protein
MPARKAPARGMIVTEMTLAKETKGTYVYAAVADNSAVPTLYVRKMWFPNGTAPESIRLTIEV